MRFIDLLSRLCKWRRMFPPGSVGFLRLYEPMGCSTHWFTIRLSKFADGTCQTDQDLAGIESYRHARSCVYCSALKTTFWKLYRNQPLQHALGSRTECRVIQECRTVEHGWYEIPRGLRI